MDKEIIKKQLKGKTKIKCGNCNETFDVKKIGIWGYLVHVGHCVGGKLKK